MSNRRDFFYSIFSGIASIPLFALISYKSDNDRGSCLTDADVEGPFHRENAPSRTDLSKGYLGNGERAIVSGKIMDSDCQLSLEGAVIEIWHASPEGEYDLQSDKFLFRAKLKSGKHGDYAFSTLLPASYEDNGLLRPKHIHYKVSCSGYKPLTTQLYFKGDKLLTTDIFVLKNDGLKRAKDIKNKGEISEVKFNIYLEKENI